MAAEAEAEVERAGEAAVGVEETAAGVEAAEAEAAAATDTGSRAPAGCCS